jgi:hypothetical protein
VQLENLNRYKASYEPRKRAREDELPSAMVEVVSHPLFWHDANQYLVIRDDNDHVHLTRTKVQMDMAVANSISGQNEATPRFKYEPQQGKFLDVYVGPNGQLSVIGINTKGMLWKKEFYRGFFDIFTY